MNTVRILTVIAVLQGLTLVSTWRGGVDGATAAHAGSTLPEPGADRRETIAELKSLNEKVSTTNDRLADMVKLMESGKLQVITTPADNKR
jgi:hypothetical protein